MPDLTPIRVLDRILVRGDGSFHEVFLRWLESLVDELKAVVTTPAGVIRASLSDIEPNGWKALNGQALSKTDFSALYTLIGDVHGSTDTTFNLPNMSGATLLGADTVALAGLGGSNSLTLTEAQLPAHSHGVTDPGHGHTVTDPGHTHAVTDPGHTHTTEASGAETVMSGVGADTASDTAGATGSSTTGVTVDSATTGISIASGTTGITVSSTGSGAAIDTTPRGLGVTWLIKT